MGILIERIKAAVVSGEMIAFKEEAVRDLSGLTLADLFKPYDEVFNAPSLPEGFTHATFRRKPLFTPQVRRSKLPLPVKVPEIAAPASAGTRRAWMGLCAIIGFCREEGVKLALDMPIKDIEIDSLVSDFSKCLCADSIMLDWWYESCVCEINNLFELGEAAIPLPFYNFAGGEHDESKINFIYGPHAIAEEIAGLFEEGTISLSEDDLSFIDMVGGMSALVELYANSPLQKQFDLKALWEERIFGRLIEKYPGIKLPYLCGEYPVEMEVNSIETLRFCQDYYRCFEDMDAINPGGWSFRENQDGEADLFVAHMIEIVRASLLPCPLDCTIQKIEERFYAVAA